MKSLSKRAKEKANKILGKVGVTSCPYCKAKLEEIAGCAKGGHLYGKTMNKLSNPDPFAERFNDNYITD